MGIHGRATELAHPRPQRTPKPRGRKSTPTDWAHHMGPSSGLVTIVMMTLFYVHCAIIKLTQKQTFDDDDEEELSKRTSKNDRFDF